MQDTIDRRVGDIAEGYMDAPEDGKYEAYYVVRDIHELLGIISGLRAGSRDVLVSQQSQP